MKPLSRPGPRSCNREISLWNAYKGTILSGGCGAGRPVPVDRRPCWCRAGAAERAELAIRDLSGRLLSAQEDERRRIARELHDNLSQQMALLAIGITQVTKRLGETAEPVARSIRELGQRTVEISTEIHNLSHRLHSSRLEALGLVAALRGHCHELLAHGVHATVHAEQVPKPATRSGALPVPHRPGSAEQRRQAQRRARGAGDASKDGSPGSC